MKKRFLILIISTVIVLALVLYFIFSPTSPLEDIVNPSYEQESNETQNPWKFPKITFPWSSGSSGGNKSGDSGGSTGSGSGGSGGVEEIKIKPLINYTLYVDSIPNNLTVFVNYTIDRTAYDIKGFPPYSLKIDENSKACVLVEYPGGSGTLEWKVDGRECVVKECYTPWSGCEVLMDSDHTVVVRWSST